MKILQFTRQAHNLYIFLKKCKFKQPKYCPILWQTIIKKIKYNIQYFTKLKNKNGRRKLRD